MNVQWQGIAEDGRCYGKQATAVCVCAQRRTIAVRSWRGSLASRRPSISTSWTSTTDSAHRLFYRCHLSVSVTVRL